jgi:carbamoyl-phosphate synthase small subunit
MSSLTCEPLEKAEEPPLLSGGFFFGRMKPSGLYLENGAVFEGYAPEDQKRIVQGEVVFTTGMTGYDLSLTDPSYDAQILVFTHPLVGNYGVLNSDAWESNKIHAKGVIVNHLSGFWDHPRANRSFLDWLKAENIPVLVGADTRQITRTLRDKGAMQGALSFSHIPSEKLKEKTSNSQPGIVSIEKKEIYGQKGKKILLIDCGLKLNILRIFQKFPLEIHRVPFDYDYTEEDYDGLFISNGPGDPQNYKATIYFLKKALERKKPIFGICLGAQLLALAAGATTYKMPFGHRGHNQPCMDTMSHKCYITCQNHGYAVHENTLSEEWFVSFRNINDDTVEGICHKRLPYFAVQFHPEAAPGPTDTQWLFDKFYEKL